MYGCTFFGHRDCFEEVNEKLEKVLIGLIEEHSVKVFYVGNQGLFDCKVNHVLLGLKEQYHDIKCYNVLAYMPKPNAELFCDKSLETMLPEGIENVPPKFAISWRNKWMLKNSEYVITYIKNSFGNAEKYSEAAKRMGKTVINIAE